MVGSGRDRAACRLRSRRSVQSPTFSSVYDLMRLSDVEGRPPPVHGTGEGGRPQANDKAVFHASIATFPTRDHREHEIFAVLPARQNDAGDMHEHQGNRQVNQGFMDIFDPLHAPKHICGHHVPG